MVTPLPTVNWPLVSLMVPVTVGQKVIVSKSVAFASASRSEPGPLSRLFFTVLVQGPALAVAARKTNETHTEVIIDGKVIFIRNLVCDRTAQTASSAARAVGSAGSSDLFRSE